MNVWLVEPRDPLIVRDGRPFDNDPGARSVSLAFPFPSTLAGGIRTLAGTDPSTGRFQKNTETLTRVKGIGIRGPILAELEGQKDEPKWLFPAPADALTFPHAQEHNRSIEIVPLTPLRFPDGTSSDLGESGLWTVGMPQLRNQKPLSAPPKFWYWSQLEKWLKNASTLTATANEIGSGALPRSVRSHVGIHADNWVADEGALFQTVGLEFRTNTESANQATLSSVRELALTLATDANISPTTTALGGERRLVHWRLSNHKWPSCPQEIVDQVVAEKACRVILATPAAFRAGYRPDWLLTTAPGLKVIVRSAIVGRPQVVSGWDFEIHKPKPSRRLAPSGSVYFLQLIGSDEAIRSWTSQAWLQNISDDEQSRLDGFGLALIGTWNGEPNTWRNDHGA
jgi:CRISPR-associated protein Cmr3